MNLSNIIIILDHPDESRNIGAACRAMANNDISELRIVGNRSDYDIEHIHVLAIHAGGIFDNAKFFNSIKEATADCTICAGTTRRRGKKRGKLLLPEEFADMADDITGAASGGKVAVIFGNERTGLTDEQLDEGEVTMNRNIAIIRSMTNKERKNPNILNASRRKRIAAGSGTTVQDVNNLIRQYDQSAKLMKQMTKGGFKMPKGFPGGKLGGFGGFGKRGLF